MPKKIKIQKYLKISKGTKNTKNPHILRTLPFLHFEVLIFFGDLIWLGYYLNNLIIIRECLVDAQKN